MQTLFTKLALQKLARLIMLTLLTILTLIITWNTGITIVILLTFFNNIFSTTLYAIQKLVIWVFFNRYVHER